MFASLTGQLIKTNWEIYFVRWKLFILERKFLPMKQLKEIAKSLSLLFYNSYSERILGKLTREFGNTYFWIF